MNSSLETSTEINLNFIATTEKTSLTETVIETVETVLSNVTNLTEESQYNDSTIDVNGQFSNEQFQCALEFPSCLTIDYNKLQKYRKGKLRRIYLVELKSEQDPNDEGKELNPTWMIIQITFVFVSICALILRSFYTICWEEKQVNDLNLSNMILANEC